MHSLSVVRKGAALASTQPYKKRKTSQKPKKEFPLPRELIGKIFSFLSIQTICGSCSLISKSTLNIFESEQPPFLLSKARIHTKYSSSTVVKIFKILSWYSVKELDFYSGKTMSFRGRRVIKNFRKVRLCELEALADINTLKKLHLKGPSFKNLNLESIKELPLETFKAEGFKFSTSSYEVIGSLPLEELSLIDTITRDTDLEKIQNLNLRFLNLNDNHLTDGALFYLRKMNLEVLRIEETEIEGRGLTHLKKDRIKKICLCNTCITTQGLVEVGKMTNLEHMCLEYTRFAKQSLASLKKLKFLTYLNLGNTFINDESLLPLRGLPLSYLNLKGCKLVTGTNSLRALLQAFPLQQLNFKGANLSKKNREKLVKEFSLKETEIILD